jgi:hypothetical protein
MLQGLTSLPIRSLPPDGRARCLPPGRRIAYRQQVRTSRSRSQAGRGNAVIEHP